MTTAFEVGSELRMVAFPAAAMQLKITKARLCELVLARNVSVLRQGASPMSWYLTAADVERLVADATPPPLPAELADLRPGALDVFQLLADWGGTATMRQLEAGTGASFTSVWRNLHALRQRGLAEGERNAPWRLTDAGREVAERWSTLPN
jgi:uncharacterized membrane protein